MASEGPRGHLPPVLRCGLPEVQPVAPPTSFLTRLLSMFVRRTHRPSTTNREDTGTPVNSGPQVFPHPELSIREDLEAPLGPSPALNSEPPATAAGVADSSFACGETRDRPLTTGWRGLPVVRPISRILFTSQGALSLADHIPSSAILASSGVKSPAPELDSASSYSAADDFPLSDFETTAGPPRKCERADMATSDRPMLDPPSPPGVAHPEPTRAKECERILHQLSTGCREDDPGVCVCGLREGYASESPNHCAVPCADGLSQAAPDIVVVTFDNSAVPAATSTTSALSERAGRTTAWPNLSGWLNKYTAICLILAFLVIGIFIVCVLAPND